MLQIIKINLKVNVFKTILSTKLSKLNYSLQSYENKKFILFITKKLEKMFE